METQYVHFPRKTAKDSCGLATNANGYTFGRGGAEPGFGLTLSLSFATQIPACFSTQHLMRKQYRVLIVKSMTQ